MPADKIITNLFTLNPYITDGRYITGSNLKGFFLHMVACPQPDPMAFYKSWNKTTYTRAGINGFICPDYAMITAPCLDKKGTVKRMPHAGKPYGNNYYIGFEQCEPSYITYTDGWKWHCPETRLEDARQFYRDTYAQAVNLFARLCIFHGLDPLKDGVIVSHKEGYDRGIASNHGDPDATWKQAKCGLTMDGFRADVAAKIKEINDEVDIDMTTTELNKLIDTRAQAQAEKVLKAYFSSLEDNDAGEWSQEARDYAIETGLIKGIGTNADGTVNYAWGAPVTREQLVTILYRMDLAGIDESENV